MAYGKRQQTLLLEIVFFMGFVAEIHTYIYGVGLVNDSNGNMIGFTAKDYV